LTIADRYIAAAVLTMMAGGISAGIAALRQWQREKQRLERPRRSTQQQSDVL